jgi:hypothetical protein
MSLMVPRAQDVYGIKDLEAFTPDIRGRYVLTWSDIHLTFSGHHHISLKAAVLEIEKIVNEKSYAVGQFSAVQESWTCRSTGMTCANTHIAIKIARQPGVKFRIYNRETFAIIGMPEIRLIKKEHQWEWITRVFHPSLGPVLCSSGYEVVLPPKARGDVERYMRAKAAYEAFQKTNTDLIREIFMDNLPVERGNNHWFSFFESTAEVADYLMMHNQAVTFHNCWSEDIIATELQRLCNAGDRTKCVILCLTNGRPADAVALEIYAVCDKISTGTLQVPKYRSGDAPLNTWRPHVVVFANFHPDIDLGFDNGHWTLVLPTQMNNAGHLFVPRTYVETMVEAARRCFKPVPGIVAMGDVLGCLRGALSDFEVSAKDVGEFRTVTEAVRALLNLYTPWVLVKYWQKGYNPIIYVYKKYGCPVSDNELTDLELVGETVKITRTTTLSSIIGKNATVGNLIVRSVPLTAEGKEIVARRIERLPPLPSMSRIEDIARDGDHPVSAAAPLLTESAPSREPPNMGPFDEKGMPFPDFGEPDNGEVNRTLSLFLREYGAVWGFKTPTPLGDVQSNGWLVESKQIIVEIDSEAPSKGEAYKMLYWWNEKGIRTIRMRADDIELDWQFGLPSTAELEHALRDRTCFMYLDRVRERDSWKALKENLGPYKDRNIAHELWWEDHVGPLRSDIAESPQDVSPEPQPSLDPTLSPLSDVSGTMSDITLPAQSSVMSNASGSTVSPDGQQKPQNKSVDSPVATVRWAVYCRTLAGAEDLIKQRNHCVAHAKALNLTPIAGPIVIFEDMCSPETHPDARPGLQAFLRSGATGMLCAHRSHLASTSDLVAATAFLRARGIIFRPVDG